MISFTLASSQPARRNRPLGARDVGLDGPAAAAVVRGVDRAELGVRALLDAVRAEIVRFQDDLVLVQLELLCRPADARAPDDKEARAERGRGHRSARASLSSSRCTGTR